MKIIFIRTGPPYYELIENKLEDRLPKNSILSNSEIPVKDIIERIKYRSIISSIYLIKFKYTEKRDKHDFAKLIKKVYELDYVTLIVYISSKDDYTTLQTLYNKYNPKLFDSYSASEGIKNIYIEYKLKQYNPNVKVSNAMIAEIRKRLRGYTDINGFLVNLSHSVININTIRKIIPKYKILNARTFPMVMFLKRNKVSLKSFDELLCNYKYYPKPLVDSTVKYFNMLNVLYTDYLLGRFTEINYLKYVEDIKMSSLNKYNAKDILDRFETISPIKMLAIISKISELENERDNFKIVLLLYRVIRIF